MVTLEDLQELKQDPAFEALDALFSRFNVFETLGIERREIRHSKVLAFLLDPSEPHGIGDKFTKAFLSRVLSDLSDETQPVDIDEVQALQLDRLSVEREWTSPRHDWARSLDLLIHDPRTNLLILIENKIDHHEGDSQLKDYYDEAERNYPSSFPNRVLPLFLTPKGRTPEGDDRYHGIAYALVHDALDEILQDATGLDPDVETFLRHYTELVRRHIMQDTEASEQAWRLYQRHREVFDFVAKHKNFRKERSALLIRDLVQDAGFVLLKEKPDVEEPFVGFLPEHWSGNPSLQKASQDDYGEEDPIVYFDFKIKSSKVLFRFNLRQGEPAIYDALLALRDESELLDGFDSNPRYRKLSRRELLDLRSYEEREFQGLQAELSRQVEHLLQTDVPRMIQLVDDKVLQHQT